MDRSVLVGRTESLFEFWELCGGFFLRVGSLFNKYSMYVWVDSIR